MPCDYRVGRASRSPGERPLSNLDATVADVAAKRHRAHACCARSRRRRRSRRARRQSRGTVVTRRASRPSRTMTLLPASNSPPPRSTRRTISRGATGRVDKWRGMNDSRRAAFSSGDATSADSPTRNRRASTREFERAQTAATARSHDKSVSPTATNRRGRATRDVTTPANGATMRVSSTSRRALRLAMSA